MKFFQDWLLQKYKSMVAKPENPPKNHCRLKNPNCKSQIPKRKKSCQSSPLEFGISLLEFSKKSFLLIFLFAPFLLKAQDAFVSGMVKDSATGEALIGVAVNSSLGGG